MSDSNNLTFNLSSSGVLSLSIVACVQGYIVNYIYYDACMCVYVCVCVCVCVRVCVYVCVCAVLKVVNDILYHTA